LVTSDMVVDGGMESSRVPVTSIEGWDDSKKDQRELIKVCAVILYWPFGGSEFTIPCEIAPMYGARPPFGTFS